MLNVLILCGGKGERLKPGTDQIPKPLVEIKGKPIIHYLISYFEHYGFVDVNRNVWLETYEPGSIQRTQTLLFSIGKSIGSLLIIGLVIFIDFSSFY